MALAGALEIQLFANMARLQTDMNQAKGIVGGAMASVERSVAQAKSVLASLGIGLGLREVIAMSDQYTLMAGKIKNATTSQAQFNQVMADSKRIASVAQADLGAIAQSYARLLNNTRDLGVSQKSLSSIVETATLALKVNGASVQESASALQQLSQAFGKGKLDGDEFRTMMEAAPGLMRRVADSMGVPFGALKDLGAQGKITGEELVKAFSDQKYLDDLREQAKGMMTISGAFVVMKNSLMELIGEYTKASGAVDLITSALAQSAKQANATDGSFSVFRETLRSLIVFGGNVSFVLKGIGNDIGGLFAMMEARGNSLGQRDYDTLDAKAKSIRKMMEEDGKKNRAEFDAWEKKMMSLGTTAKAVGEIVEGAAIKPKKATAELTEEQKKAIKAYEAIQKKAEGFISALEKESAQLGMTAIQKRMMDAATVALTLKTDKERVAVMAAAGSWAAKQQALEDAIEAEKKATDAVDALIEKLNAQEMAQTDAAMSIEMMARGMDEETYALTHNTKEMRLHVIELALVKSGLDATSEAYATMKLRLEEASKANSMAQEAKKATDAQIDMWKSIDQVAQQTFVSIFDSGKSAFDRLRDTLKNGLYALLYEITVKKWLISIAASVGGTGGSAWAQSLGGGGAGGGSLLSMGSNASSYASMGNMAYNMVGSGVGGLGSIGAGGMMTAAPVYEAGGVMVSAAQTSWVPVVGWVAAIALIAYAIWGGKGGGPKIEGNAVYDYSTDLISKPSTYYGGGDRDGGGGGDMARQIIKPASEAIETYVKSLGGSLNGLASEIFFNRDPQGDAPSSIGTYLIKDGKKVYEGGGDYGRSDDEFMAGMTLNVQRMQLAAVKFADDIPPIFTAIASGIDIASASAEQLAATMTHITDAATVMQYTDANPLEGFTEQARIAGRTLMDVWNESGTSLNSLISAYDGSAASTRTLSAATQNQYVLEMQLIGQIQNALSSTHAMFGNSIESIKMSVMDYPTKYDYLRSQADSLYTQLATATDPAQIQSLADKINADINSAYGLLDAGQKQGASGEFVTYLEKVDTLTTDRLTRQQDQVVQNHKDLTDAIENAMDAAAAKMMAAANAMLVSVTTPQPPHSIIVDLRTNIQGDPEVSIG